MTVHLDDRLAWAVAAVHRQKRLRNISDESARTAASLVEQAVSTAGHDPDIADQLLDAAWEYCYGTRTQVTL